MDDLLDKNIMGKFEETKTPEINQGILDLTKQIVTLREKHAKLKKEAAGIWIEKERLEANLIEQMQTLELKNFRHEDLGLISIGERIWGRITDVDKARVYFESQGIADSLLGYGLKKGGGQARLNEIIRGCIENGEVVPEGLDFSNKSTITQRQS